MKSDLLELTDENFEAEVVKSDIPVMVDFYAEGCGPCHMIMPVLESIDEEMGGGIKVGKVNIEVTNLTGKYDVRSVPSVLLFKNGQVVGRKIGFQNKESLKELLSGDEKNE